jgi:hypothetical protein
MQLLVVALLALFSAVQVAAESLPNGEQSDVTQIPSAADILHKDDQRVTGPLDRTSDDVSEFLLQELNERGAVEPLPPSILVLPSKPDD